MLDELYLLDEWYKCYMDGTRVGRVVQVLDELYKRWTNGTSVT